MPDIGIPAGSTKWTFLYLVQRLAQECGVTSNVQASLTTLEGVTGEAARLRDWIQSAWWDIQAMHQDWKFLRRSTTFPTIDGQATYTPLEAGITVDTFGRWDVDSFRNYLTTGGINGEQFMTFMDYDPWRDLYQLGALRTSKSQPFKLTVTPDNSLGLGPVPLAGYTVLGDYYLAPKELASDLELTTLPKYHNPMIIVYVAMRDYGGFEAASEVYQRADLGYRRLLSKLENDQLNPVLWCAPL